MTTKSPLRQLARDYYEGHIDRADYRSQRKRLLAELVSGSAAATPPYASRDSVPHSVFDNLDDNHLDSTDLANALASREAVAPSGSELIPDLSAPSPDDPEPENPVSPAQEQAGQQPDSGNPRLWLRLLVLLSLLLCSGAAAVFFYLQQ